MGIAPNLVREKFLKEYEEWCKTDKEPALSSKDMRYFLDCNEKRLKEKGIRVTEEYAVVEEDITGDLDRSHGDYVATVSYRECRHNTEYFRGDKSIKKISQPETVYVNVLDKFGYEDFECTCPNCGHKTMASELSGGCPYCGTMFEIAQTYPCVQSIYSVQGIMDRVEFPRKIKKRTITFGIICGIILFLLTFFTSASEYVIWFRILYSLFLGGFCGAVFAFIFYMATSYVLLVKALRLAGKSLKLLGGINTRKKLLKAMEQVDPGFSFELFEGKILGKLRAIAFSEKRDDLSIYSGDEDLSYLDDIIKMSYRGAIQLKRFRNEGGYSKIKLRAFMTDTYARGDKGDKIKLKDETFEVECERKSEGNFDLGFTVHAVKCRTCQGSFDAMHRKACPYCGKEYDLAEDDWVISSIVRV